MADARYNGPAQRDADRWPRNNGLAPDSGLDRDRRGYDAPAMRRDRERDRERDRDRDRHHSHRDRPRGRSRSPSHSHSRSRSRSNSVDRLLKERRRKRKSGWDVPPTPEQAAAQAAAAAAALQGLPVTAITNQAPTVSGSIHPSRLGLVASSSSSSTPLANTNVPAANPSAQRQARRLYIGNLPLPINENELRALFNAAFPAAFPQQPPGDAVVSVYLNLEKKFGFVEFRNTEEATMAMQLDGIMLRGISLRVKRPSDYVPPTTTVYTPTVAPAPGYANSLAQSGFGGQFAAGGMMSQVPPPGVILTQVPDGPNKVFCGGLPYTLSEVEIKELLQSFGQLRAFHLVKDKDTGGSKGYCFFEYLDPTVTDIAVGGLNNMRIGERTLTVRRAQPKGPDGSFIGGGGGGGMGGGGDGLGSITAGMTPAQLGALAAMRATSAISGLSSLSSSRPPTRVLVLLHMVTASELVDDGEYKDILDDITLELSKYGRVLSVLIPRPSTSGDAHPGLGKVYVEYAEVAEAMKARAEVEGRQFANRVVQCDYMDVERYLRKEF